ncbi:MAG: hypothetical protein JJU00_14860 [Opitutales bacterium]|nr:hypothetical protein [Opitutales bacterium]
MNSHTDTTTPPETPSVPSKLVDAHGLLKALFDEESRPSLRWLRKMQAQRRIPYIKISRIVRFDVDEVRTALAENSTVRARIPQRSAECRSRRRRLLS